MKISIPLLLYYLTSYTYAAPPKAHELTADYSFEQYIVDFGKESSYHNENDTKLYQAKKQIFESNLERILTHNSYVQYDIKTGKRRENADVDGSTNGHTYHMGVNQFMDLSEDEIKSVFFGYDKTSFLHKGLVLQQHSKDDSDEDKDHKMDLPFDITDVSTLPLSINYATNRTITSPVKNQGGCGSCWSFSSIAALETHLAIQSSRPVDILSTQELVSCVHNPNQCGGTGGCEGATAELAYNYVANHGIMKEESFPYEASDGPVCPLKKDVGRTKFENDMLTSTKRLRSRRAHAMTKNDEGATIDSAARTTFGNAESPVIAKVKGYANIPSNNYKALMNAVAKHGPVVVALAASSWSFYEGGVYSPPQPTEAVDWDLNHGVVVEGYGTDEVTGENYWLVRNSWSDMWGENGYIRLKRVDPSSAVDDNMKDFDCGYDETPLDGIGCALNPDGSEVVQKKVKVCGTNGLLSDPVIPVGGYVL